MVYKTRQLAGIGEIDKTAIILDELKRQVGNMGHDDAWDIAKNLPESVVRRLCQEGAKDEFTTGYLPYIVFGGILLLILTQR